MHKEKQGEEDEEKKRNEKREEIIDWNENDSFFH